MTTSDPRQLIVLCDGTNNTLTGGQEDTNLVKLLEQIRAQPNDPNQIVFYDPGVGSTGSLPAVTVWDEIKQWNQRMMGLAFGGGIFENIAQSYEFLMRNYKDGDQIFLFGFSRGAFTARSVAGLVDQFGLLQPQMEHMVPSLVQLYFKKRDGSTAAIKAKAVAHQMRETLVSSEHRHVDIQYIGVWDTVASVGFGPLKTKMTAIPTVDKKCFLNVRHAMSLDEQRAQFAVRLYSDDNDTTGKYKTVSGKDASLIQQWFPGCHCDVGGGNPQKQSMLSNIALNWLVNEAISCGLRLAPSHAAAKTVPEPHPIQSQTYLSPFWALTGLHVRDTRQGEIDGGKVFHVEPVAHTDAYYETLAFPKSTLWAKRPKLHWMEYAVLVLGLLGLWAWKWSAFGRAHTAIATMGHFVFILSYVYVLTYPVTWAFAKLAGLRKITSSAGKDKELDRLNSLGWMLPAVAAGHLLTFTWSLFPIPYAVAGCFAVLVVSSFSVYKKWMTFPVFVVLALPWLAQWGGLAGVAYLLGLAIFKHFQHRNANS